MKKEYLTVKSSISPLEYLLLEKLRKTDQTVFTGRDAARTIGWSQIKTNQVLSRLSKKKIIVRTKRGQYMIDYLNAETTPEETAQKTVWPSYLSYWTALRMHDFTEQLPSTIFVATTRKSGQSRVAGFKVKYVKITPYRFFGYVKMGEAAVADPEKALVDSLTQPKYAGGMREVAKCLKRAWPDVDQKKLLEYALKMRNKTLVGRLGYLACELRLGLDGRVRKKLLENTGKGYSRLDPAGDKTGSLNREWKLIVNTQVTQ